MLDEEEFRKAQIDMAAVEFSEKMAIENPGMYNTDEMRVLVERHEVSKEEADRIMREDLASMPPGDAKGHERDAQEHERFGGSLERDLRRGFLVSEPLLAANETAAGYSYHAGQGSRMGDQLDYRLPIFW